MSFHVDFVPSKNTLDFNFLRDEPKWISYSQEESKSQDLLSSIRDEQPKKVETKTTVIVSIPIDLGLDSMQDETTTLKEIAEKIFNEQYNLKLPEVDQKIALTLEKFKE